MHTMKRNILLLAAALVLIVGVAACGANPTANTESNSTGNTNPPANATPTTNVVLITEQQASSIVENLLKGYNTGDYATFTRDLTPEMKSVITEDLFQQFVTASQATLGQFKSIKSIEQGTSNDTSTSWAITIEFEKSTEQFTFTFNKATGQIESMNFGPVQ